MQAYSLLSYTGWAEALFLKNRSISQSTRETDLAAARQSTCYFGFIPLVWQIEDWRSLVNRTSRLSRCQDSRHTFATDLLARG